MDGLEAARRTPATAGDTWPAPHAHHGRPAVLAQDRQTDAAGGMDGFASHWKLPKLMAEMARVLSEHSPPRLPARPCSLPPR